MRVHLKFLSSLLLIGLFLFTSFTPINNEKTKVLYVDENIEVSTGAIYGANDVTVNFTRTGNDAGLSEVYITYTIRFNEGTSNQSTQTFTKVMSYGETTSTEHIQGPNPTAWAEVRDVFWNY